MPLIDHWRTCFRQLRLAVPPDQEFDRLIGRYSEPHRAYHTVQHLEECFRAFEAGRSSAQSPGAVGIALFFHDAIYDTHVHDNEEKSAELARHVLADANADAQLLSYVTDLVLATRHAAVPETMDQQLVADIDLSILGASRQRFDEYERQVRQEYSWVDETIFRTVRSRILQELLARPAIYSTPDFHTRLEQTARENLARSIVALV